MTLFQAGSDHYIDAGFSPLASSSLSSSVLSFLTTLSERSETQTTAGQITSISLVPIFLTSTTLSEHSEIQTTAGQVTNVSSVLSFLTSTTLSERSETQTTAEQVTSTSATVVSSPPVVVAHGVAVLTVAVPVGVTAGVLLLVAAVGGIAFVW